MAEFEFRKESSPVGYDRMASPAERAYLFGLLAFQRGLIRRDQLLAIVNAWSRRKSTPIAELFLEQQILDCETIANVGALLERCLEDHEHDFERCARSLESDARGTLRSLDELVYILRSLAEPDVLATLPPATRPTAPMGNDLAVGPETLLLKHPSEDAQHRFQTLRPHAKGGLGEVFIAQDSELNREVALKEIQSRYADNPNSRERFILEAEITGSLEHPGIVPVYGLGQYSDGRPFYAMRFVKGDTFKDAIEQFHRLHSHCDFKTGEASIEFRKLLGRFIDVCETIEYAHSRGVLHRDLKPANIMLGKYGETLVVDWGLAKIIGRAERYRTSAEATIAPESGSGSQRTRVGSALGTPAFMSPEQAAGKLDDLGPAADVYSLGATLYCLLTGQLPFGQNETLDASTLLMKVQQGDFPRPRSIQPKIPRPLEAICLKAMSIKPSDRHPSPQELANELERWLADEPLLYYQEPLTSQATRFARRHRALLGASIVSLLLIATVASVSAFIVNGLRRKAEQHAHLESQQRQAAQLERNRAKAAEQQLKVAAEATEQSLYLAQIHVAAAEWLHGGIDGMTRVLEKTAPNRRGFEWNYLDAQTKRDLVVYRDHAHAVKAVALSPDQQLVVSGDAKGELRVWNSQDGSTIFQANANRWDINALAFHPSGKQFAVAGHLGKLALWDLDTRSEIREFRGHPAQVFDVAFHPKGTTLASAGADRSVRIWNSTDGTLLQELIGHRLFATTVAFSPDGSSLASGGQEGSIFLWDSESGATLSTLPADMGPVAEIALSPDGKLLASVHELPFIGQRTTTYLVIWDLATQSVRHKLALQQGSIMAVAFSPDSMYVASGADDGTIHLVDVQQGRSQTIHRCHTGRVWDVLLSSDGKRLISCGEDGTVKIRSAMTDARFTQLDLGTSAQALSLAYGPSADWIAVGKESGARLLSTIDGTTLGEYESERGATMSYAAIAVDPKGSRIAALSESQQRVTLWDTVSKRLLGHLTGHTDTITAIQWTHDGQQAFTASRDGTLRAWNISTQQQTALYTGHKYPVESIAMDPQGRFLVAVTAEKQERPGLSEKHWPGELLIWPLDAPTSPKRLGDSDHAYRAVAIAAQPSTLAAARADGIIELWDTNRSQRIATLVGHTGTVSSVAFFPDGRRLVSGGEDRTIRIWDLKTSEQLLELRGHAYPVQSVAVSPEGRELVSAAVGPGLRGELLVWSSEMGR